MSGLLDPPPSEPCVNVFGRGSSRSVPANDALSEQPALSAHIPHQTYPPPNNALASNTEVES